MSRFTILFLLGTTIVNANPATHLVHPSESPVPAMDTIPPSITCPPDITLTLGPTGCDTVFHYTVTATDNTPGVIVAKVSGLASGAKFPAGLTTNLFIAVDAAGNTATCSFTVRVVSNPPSAVQCNDEVVQFLDANCMRTVLATEVLEPPFGCLDAYKIEVDFTVPFGNGPWNPAVFGSNDLGKTYQFRVTNIVNGNYCWGNITLRDTLRPAPACSTLNIPCAVPTEHLTPAFLKDSLGFLSAMPTVPDNCPGASTLTFSDVGENLACGAPDGVTARIRRTWIARDISGNSATCLQTINRVRSLDFVEFPERDTVYCADASIPPSRTGSPYVAVGGRRYSLLTAPACEIDAFYEDLQAKTCGGSRRIAREWEVRDACLPSGPGNPIKMIQIIVVLDTSAPVVQCPANQLFLIRADSTCRVPVRLPDVSALDDCSPVTEATAFWNEGALIKTRSGVLKNHSGNDPMAFDTLAVFDTIPNFPTGVTEMLYAISDACGNVTSCSFLVEVWDSIPPIAVCDSVPTVYFGADGLAVLAAAEADNGSSDACNDLTFKIRRVTSGGCMPGDTLLNDVLVACCAEEGDTIAAILRVYDVANPAGETQDGFGLGQYSECLLQVVVADTFGLGCAAPPDVTTTCDAFLPDLSEYGSFSSSCVADSTQEVGDYAQFDSLCRSGTLIRYFRAFDTASGQSRTCSQIITVNPEPYDYYVRFPDDKIITECDSTGSFGEGPQWIGLGGCEHIVVTYTDELFTVVPDACYRIERQWTVYNSCTYNPNLALVTIPNPNPNPITNHPNNLPGPVVSAPNAMTPWAPTTVAINPGATPTNFSTFWSADANGYTYKQIIKVIDVKKPVALNCPIAPLNLEDASDNDPNFWNALYWSDPVSGQKDMCEGAVDLCLTATDLCSGSDLNIRYILYLDLDNNGTQETSVSSSHAFVANTVYYGNTSGNGTARQFDFRSVPGNQKYGFAIQTSTSGRNQTACVRWRNVDNPGSFVLPQLPYGTHRIRWLADDACGNETTCEYTFSVQNAAGICGADMVPISGNIQTEAGAGVEAVNVRLNRVLAGVPDWTQTSVTDANGDYSTQAPSGGSYTLAPELDVAPLNGVSTLDMLLINKHILGQDTLDSPFKIIAADANKSRSITTFDIVELRKLILGVYSKLPNNTSWRFVDAGFVFPQPENPLQTVFPETITGLNHTPQNPPVHDFIAVKVGDVNGNASPGVMAATPVSRDAAPIRLTIPDRVVHAGDTVDVRLAFPEPVAGFQLTLALVGMDVLDVLPGPGMGGEHFAVFPEDGLLTVSWTGAGTPAFVLRLRADRSGRLSDQIHLSRQIAVPEAYLASETGYRIADLVLHVEDGDYVYSPTAGLELYQNRPNPVSNSTQIRFFLPESGTATLRVNAPDGRLVFEKSGYFRTGLHSIPLHREQFGGATGVFFYTLETGKETRTKRMIVPER